MNNLSREELIRIAMCKTKIDDTQSAGPASEVDDGWSRFDSSGDEVSSSSESSSSSDSSVESVTRGRNETQSR